MILDLAGNKVCFSKAYRPFAVFHLTRLKILNGAPITVKEQSEAKDELQGKLTHEILAEKIGTSFKNVTELDLRNLKIKEADCICGKEFRNLRRLNFDNNLLVNIDSFATLAGLKVLSLNCNRLERLFSRDPIGNQISSLNSQYSFTPVPPCLAQIEELYLGSNNIARISDLGLHRCPSLKLLYLQGNSISKLEGLENMTNMVELVLNKNQIRCAEPASFVSLIKLRSLHLKYNRLI
jgi:Leucine-rich repeat (LRR) protein